MTSPILTPDAELHAPRWLDRGVTLCHRLLNGDRAFERVHDAGELGEDAIAGRVDDAPTELADHRQDDRLVPLEIAYSARLIRAHQRAVAGDIGRQDCYELA